MSIIEDTPRLDLASFRRLKEWPRMRASGSINVHLELNGLTFVSLASIYSGTPRCRPRRRPGGLWPLTTTLRVEVRMVGVFRGPSGWR